MAQIQYKDLLDAGVHFGHLTRKWDPRMAPYIFMEKNGIHIIDLNQSLEAIAAAQAFVKSVVRSGRKVMFVATKKQAQEIVSEEANRLKMPFVTERWLGGMLTNFTTIKKSLKKMNNIDKMLSDEATAGNIAKREKLMLGREKAKLEKLLGGVADLSRLPAAIFVVDIKREHLAIAEAKRLGIPVVAMCDTNSNPEIVDFAIPSNDDAYKSISLITLAIGKAIEEGILERKTDKENAALQEEEDAKRAVDTAREVVNRGEESSEGGKRKRVKTADAAPEAEAAPVVEEVVVEAAPVAEEAAPEAPAAEASTEEAEA
ncbi:MAG: 30S ribosomal protein S2 [Cytophagaceae bacterium]|nr:30S ribosomal protein S2 [Cytophagaceae bacterium]MBK9508841.1 30S ribosomal protein S2 [Cytophagaceae bacterium]MBK9935747.1 30S ribosomal protein S2 [Cytophagaceae bacterium]MBL0302181.1 30S ribosomal protein S2 [Cytophagaceae bacterium]MBL0325006.1 30S ribosomal protein S2 [Cytophagaceae bacterium]